MKIRHAAALALVGWYLMLAPTQADLDKSCRSDSIFTVSDAFWGLVAHWACKKDDCAKNPREVHSIRCNLLGNEVATDAPLGLWQRIDEFETLAPCKAEYESYQEEQSRTFDQEDARDLAKQELLDEGRVTRPMRKLTLALRKWLSFFRLGTRPRNASRATIRASRKNSYGR